MPRGGKKTMSRRLLFPCFILILINVAVTTANRGYGQSPSLQLLPREQEMELATSAAPEHLRKDATVYVFGKGGYEKARTGTNGFTCLVNRDGAQAGDQVLRPTCWDLEGSNTILPVMLRVGELLAQGKTAAEIKRDVDSGFSDG